MPVFGERSWANRLQCHGDLILVLDKAITMYDFSVICGHRDEETQNVAFYSGRSTVKWPKSYHNRTPAEAFDVIPYPNGFNSTPEEFYTLATYILHAASCVQVPLIWGGHWTSLVDMAHFQLGTRR